MSTEHTPEEEDRVSLTAFYRSMEQLMQALRQTFEAMTATLLPIWKAISDYIWAQYRDAGMPYGDCQEGLLAWLKDMDVIHQHACEIGRIRQRHETLIHARLLGEKIRISHVQREKGREGHESPGEDER